MSAEQQHRDTVLVVDDVPQNIQLLEGILEQEYQVKAARRLMAMMSAARSRRIRKPAQFQ